MEHALSFATMLTVMPWVKYYINATDPLDLSAQGAIRSADDLDLVAGPWRRCRPRESARDHLSRSRQEGRLAKRMDMWRIMSTKTRRAPPPGRRWANGDKAGNIFTLLTHVTHAVAEARGVTDRVRSVELHRTR